MAPAPGRVTVVDPAHFHDLDAKGLEPGEKPVQGRLIGQWAMQDGFYRLDGSREPLEVKQGFGR
jgi:hypothetical protein